MANIYGEEEDQDEKDAGADGAVSKLRDGSAAKAKEADDAQRSTFGQIQRRLFDFFSRAKAG